MARQYAAILGLLALVVSLLRSLAAGSMGGSTLWTAWLALMAFTAVGAVLGWLAERIVRDSVSSQIMAELGEQKNKPGRPLAAPGAAQPVT